MEGDATRARFVYGSCAQEPDYEADAGCWAPLELIVEPLAASGPSRYAAGIECRWRRVRELPVALLPTAHTVQVFTGDTTVTMYARELALMLHAASALRPLAERRARVGPLPAPPASLVSALSERCMPAKHQP